jgi:hypothetical protein
MQQYERAGIDLRNSAASIGLGRLATQYTRGSPRSLALERTGVVCDGVVHRIAAGETKREGHGGLAGKRIVGGE